MTQLAADPFTNPTTLELTVYSANLHGGSQWTYATYGRNSSGVDMTSAAFQVTSTGLGSLGSGNSGTNTDAAMAYFNAATLPADQYVQVTTINAASTPLGIALRCSGPATPASIGTSYIGFGVVFTAYHGIWYKLANSAAGVLIASTQTVASANGDTWYFRLQGNNYYVTRTTTGGVTTTIYNATLPTAAQAIVGSRAGIVGTGSTNTATRLTNWSAGDLLVGPFAPTPPTTNKGVYSVRSTAQP